MSNGLPRMEGDFLYLKSQSFFMRFQTDSDPLITNPIPSLIIIQLREGAEGLAEFLWIVSSQHRVCLFLPFSQRRS